MKKANLLLLAIILLILAWNNYYPKWTLTGTFVSNNETPVLEGPSSIDTLILYDDGTFINGAWGKGEYEIDGDEIHFTYDYSFGKAGFRSHLDRAFFIWKPRISLNTDLRYYYRKIN